MDRNIIAIYTLSVANLRMNYQIMSALVSHNNPILKEWKDYIEQTEVILQDLKQQLDKVSN